MAGSAGNDGEIRLSLGGTGRAGDRDRAGVSAGRDGGSDGAGRENGKRGRDPVELDGRDRVEIRAVDGNERADSAADGREAGDGWRLGDNKISGADARAVRSGDGDAAGGGVGRDGGGDGGTRDDREISGEAVESDSGRAAQAGAADGDERTDRTTGGGKAGDGGRLGDDEIGGAEDAAEGSGDFDFAGGGGGRNGGMDFSAGDEGECGAGAVEPDGSDSVKGGPGDGDGGAGWAGAGGEARDFHGGGGISEILELNGIGIETVVRIDGAAGIGERNGRVRNRICDVGDEIPGVHRAALKCGGGGCRKHSAGSRDRHNDITRGGSPWNSHINAINGVSGADCGRDLESGSPAGEIVAKLGTDSRRAAGRGALRARKAPRSRDFLVRRVGSSCTRSRGACEFALDGDGVGERGDGAGGEQGPDAGGCAQCKCEVAPGGLKKPGWMGGVCIHSVSKVFKGPRISRIKTKGAELGRPSSRARGREVSCRPRIGPDLMGWCWHTLVAR